jgi:hypothetical protein
MQQHKRVLNSHTPDDAFVVFTDPRVTFLVIEARVIAHGRSSPWKKLGAFLH